jgi:hypothetical protein
LLRLDVDDASLGLDRQARAGQNRFRLVNLLLMGEAAATALEPAGEVQDDSARL